MNNSDYIVYADESGTHDLDNINPHYPFFVLVFCIFKIEDYKIFSQKILDLKFKYFGHDQVILHERDIRLNSGDFKFNQGFEYKSKFVSELAKIIKDQEFNVVASVINKILYKEQHSIHENLYNLSLKFCLDLLYPYLSSLEHNYNSTHIVLEAREKYENIEVENVFNYYCNNNANNVKYNYFPRIVPKNANSSGLQLADLIAMPIGQSQLIHINSNRSFKIIEKKFVKDKSGNYLNTGLKLYPKEKQQAT